MPVNPELPSGPAPTPPRGAPTTPRQPQAPVATPPKSSEQTLTLGEVPGLAELLKAQQQQQPSYVPPTPVNAHPLGESDADSLGMGEQSFENDNDAMGALTFDNAGAQAQMADQMSHLHLPDLKKLGVTQNSDGSYTTVAPDGSTEVKESGWRAGVIAAARKMLGTPYVWGGTSHSGVDCSGLIQLVFKSVGINMPRISADQARHGKRISLSKLRPGDLVGWDNSSRNNGADHIALYIGHGLIIEAPRPGGHVQISHLYDTGEAWGVSLGFK